MKIYNFKNQDTIDLKELLESRAPTSYSEYEAVVNALRTKEVDTPLGSIRFDDRGDAIGVGFSMYQVQNGRYVELN